MRFAKEMVEYVTVLPYRRVPNHTTFDAVKRRLRGAGQFTRTTEDCVRQRFVTVPKVQEEILDCIDKMPIKEYLKNIYFIRLY